MSLTGLLERKDQAVGTLSGGQKQLTAIAGCLAVKAPVLVLDEATAMLDPEASLAIGEKCASFTLQVARSYGLRKSSLSFDMVIESS